MERVDVATAWFALMLVALIVALAASLPPRRPIAVWLGDFFVRWGLAGILVWLVVNGLWAIREVVGQKLRVPFSPLEAYLEYATVWSAVLTGMATFLFFATTLLLNALFEERMMSKRKAKKREEKKGGISGK